jgi:hypothetical protein
MRALIFTALLLVGVVAGCSDDTSATQSPGAHTISGYVHAGPTCPVMTDPPDPACADRPVDGAALHILDARGEIVASVATGVDGTFTALLDPGTYTLVPQPADGLLGTADPQTLTVSGNVTGLDVAYDTGIR